MLLKNLRNDPKKGTFSDAFSVKKDNRTFPQSKRIIKLPDRYTVICKTEFCQFLQK
jgi:hypothetical protein